MQRQIRRWPLTRGRSWQQPVLSRLVEDNKLRNLARRARVGQLVCGCDEPQSQFLFRTMLFFYGVASLLLGYFERFLEALHKVHTFGGPSNTSSTMRITIDCSPGHWE
jgi:hypothetical protein